MKRKELERKLKELGWYFVRHGGSHVIWTNGDEQEAVPRYPETNERLARGILRKAAKGKRL